VCVTHLSLANKLCVGKPVFKILQEYTPQLEELVQTELFSWSLMRKSDVSFDTNSAFILESG